MDVSKIGAVLLVVASALAGCSAQTVESFSLTTVNCQSLGIVSLTDSNFNEGTVCGTVNNATANYICDYLSYGTAVAFGTAADKGVSGGTGNIEATNLHCTSSGHCTFSTATGGCTHSQDLVLQCSDQPYICFNFPIAGIVGIAVAVLILCIVVLVTPCICCCVCACMGVACFASKSTSYNQL